MVDGSFLGRVHRYTARVPPAIRAGKGWRGRRELAPRCSATQLGALRRLAGQTPSCLNYPYHLHHLHHLHHHHHLHCLTQAFPCPVYPLVRTQRSPCWVSRRRERRLRSWAKHERLSIAMALSMVTHHSFQVGTAYDALRSQKPVNSAGGLRPPPLVEGRPQERLLASSPSLTITSEV